jgi:hypothetical protein
MEKIGMWEVMMVQLTGHTIDNIKLHDVAKSMTGDVKSSKEHLLLTQSLWKKTTHERFDELQFGYAG